VLQAAGKQQQLIVITYPLQPLIFSFFLSFFLPAHLSISEAASSGLF
jgi:hypothetical protein